MKLTTNSGFLRAALIVLVVLSLIAGITIALAQSNRGILVNIATLEETYALHDGYLYFGRPSCPSCELFLPVMELAAQQRGVQIHYFNSDYFRSETDVSDDALLEVFSHFDVVHVPLLLYLEDGVLVEAFGAELSGSSEQSMAYGQICEMMDRVIGGPGFSWVTASIAAVWLLTIICAIAQYRWARANHLLGLICLGFCGMLYLWYQIYLDHALELWVDGRSLLTMLAAGALFSGILWYKCNPTPKNGGNNHENKETHCMDPASGSGPDHSACAGSHQSPPGEPGQLCGSPDTGA